MRSGSRNPGFAAIDWNVGVGEKNAPTTRPTGDTTGTCSAGTAGGSWSDMALLLRRPHFRRGQRRGELRDRRGRVRKTLHADPLPVEIVGDGEVELRERLAVDGERLLLERARRRKVALDL